MELLGTEAAGPAAYNPARLHWEDVPAHVRALLEDRAGATVTSATSVTQGFSPGFAGVVTFADGEQMFVKAVSATPNAHSRDLAVAEAAACQTLTDDVPAPRLLWSSLDEWAVLAFEVVGG